MEKQDCPVCTFPMEYYCTDIEEEDDDMINKIWKYYCPHCKKEYWYIEFFRRVDSEWDFNY